MYFRFLFSLTFGLVFIQPFFAYAESINIAIIAPQYGYYKDFGNELIKGAEIAIDNLNGEGGINNKKVNLIIVDDPCDDVLSISTAQMMSVNFSKEDKISMIIGPYCSNSFKEVADTYAKAKIFQIIPTTINTNDREANHKGLIKMLGSLERQGDDFFKYYKDNFKDGSVALIYDSNDREVVDIAVNVQKHFVEEETKEKLITFDFNKYTSHNTLAKEVINSDAKIAYILGNSPDIHSVFKEIRSRKKYFTIFTNKYQAAEDFNQTLGKLAEGTYSFTLPSLKDNPAFTEELVKLRLIGIEPEGLSVYSYSAVKLWRDIVEQANSTEYDKLAKSVSENKFETIFGDIIFNNGLPETTLNYNIYQIISGQYKKVY